MDKKTKEALDAIGKIKSPDDVIYEIFRTEKRSGWFHFWDIVFDVIPSTTTKLLYDKVMYLLASEKSGKIIEVENGHITNIIEIPDWTSDKKVKFKKIMIDNYIYKKLKKLRNELRDGLMKAGKVFVLVLDSSVISRLRHPNGDTVRIALPDFSYYFICILTFSSPSIPFCDYICLLPKTSEIHY